MKKLFIILFILLWSNLAWGTVWYVDSVNDNCISTDPHCSTLQRALAAVSSGDTIQVAKDSTETVEPTATVSVNITNDGTQRVITSGGTLTSALKITTAPTVTIDGVDFVTRVANTCSGIVVSRSTSETFPATLSISNSTITHSSGGGSGGTNNQRGGLWIANNQSSSENSYTATVTNCKFIGGTNPKCGIIVPTTAVATSNYVNVIVDKSIVVVDGLAGNISMNSSGTGYALRITDSVVGAGGGTAVIVANSVIPLIVIARSKFFGVDLAFNAIISLNATTAYLYGNMFVCIPNADGLGVSLGSNGTYHIYNNLIYGASQAITAATSASPTFYIKNNIIMDNAVILFDANGTVVNSNNIYYNNTTLGDFVPSATDINIDPGIVGYNADPATFIANLSTLGWSAYNTDAANGYRVFHGGASIDTPSDICLLTRNYNFSTTLANLYTNCDDPDNYGNWSIGPFVHQDTFHVSKEVGASDKNSGTSINPLSTLGFFTSTNIQPGDTVNIRKGDSYSTINLTPPESGVSGYPITFSSYTGSIGEAKPIIKSVAGSTLDYITIDGLDITGATADGVELLSGADNWTIKNCAIHGNGEHGMDIVCDSCVIQNNDIYANYYNGVRANLSGTGDFKFNYARGNGTGTVLGVNNGFVFLGASAGTPIRFNKTNYNGGNGFVINGSVDTLCYNTSYEPDGDGVAVSNTRTLTNLYNHSDYGSSNGLTISGASGVVTNLVNCIFYGNTGHGVNVADVTNVGAITNHSNNNATDWYQHAAGATDLTNINPRFFDAANLKLWLKSSSPVKSKGVAIAGYEWGVSKKSVHPYIGILSKQPGVKWSMGAYPYNKSCLPDNLVICTEK